MGWRRETKGGAVFREDGGWSWVAESEMLRLKQENGSRKEDDVVDHRKLENETISSAV
jgi:hypothetical protein